MTLGFQKDDIKIRVCQVNYVLVCSASIAINEKRCPTHIPSAVDLEEGT